MTASTAVQKRPRAKQRPGDRIFAGATRTAGFVILVALAGVAIFLVAEGLPVMIYNIRRFREQEAMR